MASGPNRFAFVADTPSPVEPASPLIPATVEMMPFVAC
jgi:hypothetical protein